MALMLHPYGHVLVNLVLRCSFCRFVFALAHTYITTHLHFNLNEAFKPVSFGYSRAENKHNPSAQVMASAGNFPAAPLLFCCPPLLLLYTVLCQWQDHVQKNCLGIFNFSDNSSIFLSFGERDEGV